VSYFQWGNHHEIHSLVLPDCRRFINRSWFFFLVTGQVPELAPEPYRIAAHLLAEAATAVVLIVAGVGLLRQRSWASPVALVGLGMLIYTAINSSGYFAEQGDWPPVVVFAVLLLLALLNARSLFRTAPSS
jgi:lipopolysaccharide export LptBFGC system permease protein LptF